MFCKIHHEEPEVLFLPALLLLLLFLLSFALSRKLCFTYLSKNEIEFFEAQMRCLEKERKAEGKTRRFPKEK